MSKDLQESVFLTADLITDELEKIKREVGTLNINTTKYSKPKKPFIFRCLS